MAKDRDCGQPLHGPFSFYDQSMCAWKTSQLCLDGEWSEFWETWPRAGMTRNGKAYELPMLARRTAESESGLRPTPQAFDANQCSRTPEAMERAMAGRAIPGRNGGAPANLRERVQEYPTPRVCAGLRSSGMNRTEFYRKFWPTPDTGLTPNGHGRRGGSVGNGHQSGMSLEAAVKLWPTPSSRDWKDTPGMALEAADGRNRNDQLARRVYATPKSSASGPDYARANWTGSGGDDLATQIGGQLNPAWVCWLMGYPSDWMDLPSIGKKSRPSRASRKA